MVTRKKVTHFDTKQESELYNKMVNLSGTLGQLNFIVNSILRNHVYQQKNIQEKIAKLEKLNLPPSEIDVIVSYMEFIGKKGKELNYLFTEFIFTQTTKINDKPLCGENYEKEVKSSIRNNK